MLSLTRGDSIDLPAADTPPDDRPLRPLDAGRLDALFAQALETRDGALGAHLVHERWMRGALAFDVERMLEQLWMHAADSVPEWLPMRHVAWLPTVYEVARRFRATGTGRAHIYLVLLDYTDRVPEDYGVYVGMSRYPAAERFDQHKAGIRAAGSVLKRGLEVLTGPVWHLRFIPRKDAARIEAGLAVSLAAVGIKVKGGH